MATTRTASHAPILPRHNTETRLFLAESLRDMRTTGAIAPSGRRLAVMLAEPLREQRSRPLDVLEVGADTGAVTRALIPLLGSGSRLDVVESNARFVSHLRSVVHTHPSLVAAADRVRVQHAFIERVDTDRGYDVIVSGLPFTNFPPEQVEAIMNRCLELLHPGGILTYFAYAGTRALRTLVSSRAEIARHRAVERVLASFRRRCAVGCRTVWSNLPPARVWRLRAPQSGAASPAPQRVGAPAGHRYRTTAAGFRSLSPASPCADGLRAVS